MSATAVQAQPRATTLVLSPEETEGLRRHRRHVRNGTGPFPETCWVCRRHLRAEADREHKRFTCRPVISPHDFDDPESPAESFPDRLRDETDQAEQSMTGWEAYVDAALDLDAEAGTEAETEEPEVQAAA